MTALPPHELRRLERVAGDDPAVLARLVERRTAGEPLQYLEGTSAFGPFDLIVDPRVLIPRPETEQMWELVASLADRPAVVVDLCTGSGALAIACTSTWPDARVVAADLSPQAAQVARINAARCGTAVEVLEGDLFEPLPEELRGSVDVLVSNPPYVTDAEWDDLPGDVKCEPRMALVSGTRGTEILERIAAGAGEWLSGSGVTVCEIGETQGDVMIQVFARFFTSVEVRRDLTGRDRFVVATGLRVPGVAT